MIGQTAPEYLTAAKIQVEHLMNEVPKWKNGAISHREDTAALWADFVYMAPPAIAYYAVAANDVDLLLSAIQQCLLYRDILAVPQGQGATAGLWEHIAGDAQDTGLWSTGNGWAAAGMSRVLATAKKSPFTNSDKLSAALGELKDAIRSILDGAISLDKADPDEQLLRNYLDQSNWFGEVSGTALLATTAYRMYVLEQADFGADYWIWAEGKRAAITTHIGEDGILSPVINPLDWHDSSPSSRSPEAQSFVIMMFAAYRDAWTC